MIFTKRTRSMARLVIGPLWFEVDTFYRLRLTVMLFRREGHTFPRRDLEIQVVV